MKSFKLASFLAIGCLLLGMTGTAYADRYIVLYKKHALPKNVDTVVTQSGGKIASRIPQLGIAIVASDAPDFETLMAGAPGVKSVGIDPAFALPEYAIDTTEAVAPVSDVPVPPSAFFDAGLLWGIERVKAPEAWAAGVTGSHDTVVAVIDTGIAWNHPDLEANVVHKACYTSAGEHVGPIVPDEEYDCNPYPTLLDHGTHVAGTVAANFGGGVVGIGPNLGLASYNTFEFIPGCGVCSFSSSRWQAQFDAAERGFEVINMSLGSLGAYGGGRSSGLATFVAADARVQQAVTKAGVTVVASGGNSALDLNGVFINIPGGLPAVVNVGATGIRPNPLYEPGVSYDIPAFYTNHGAAITVAGPGGDCGEIGTCNPATRPGNWFEYLVLSSIVQPNPVCGETASCPVTWGWKAGTSMAAPHAAGVVGLIRDENPGLSASQAATVLKRTAENLGDRQQFGHGMVDARSAIGK